MREIHAQAAASGKEPGQGVTGNNREPTSLTCPVCNTTSFEQNHFDDVHLYRCPACTHCFTDFNSLTALQQYSPDYYDEAHKNWNQHPNYPLFDFVEDKLGATQAASVVDLGCGKGEFLRYLAGKNPALKLTGIDVSANETSDRIRYIQGDILEIDWGQPYQALISFAVIEHLTDVQRFVKRIDRSCAPDGVVIIMTVNEHSLFYRIARLLNWFGFKIVFERLFSRHHLNHFTISSLRKLMESNSFSVLEVYRHNMPVAAVDFSNIPPVLNIFVRLGIWIIFKLEILTGLTILQTIVCQKSPKFRH